MFKSVLAAAALVAAATPALAQDAPQTFNGPFVGVQAGWQQDSQTLSGAALATNGSNSGSGLAYGGQVGIDFRLAPTVVIGAEVALTGRTGSGALALGPFNYDVSAGRTISATGRLGYLGTPNDLFYVRGGYANANYALQDATNARISGDRDGFTVGAGYERMLAEQISARLEYGYSDFGSDGFFGGIAGPNAVAELKYRRHAITAGVNFRF